MIGVYKITNLVNNKIYIGSSSVSIKNRFMNHLSNLKYNRHSNIHLQRSYNKHGKNKLLLEIIMYILKIKLKLIQ